MNIDTILESVNHDGENSLQVRSRKGSASHKPSDCTVEQCRAKAAQIVALALSTVGLTRQTAADAAGVSKSMVDRWTGDDLPTSVPLARLLVLGVVSTRGRDAVRIIANAVLAHIEGPAPLECRRTLRDRVDDLHAEVGAFAEVWREAMLDGEVSVAEARHMLRVVHAVEQACAKVRAEAGRIVTGEVE